MDALNIDNCCTFIHQPAHDLEALLQTILGIVTFTDGPGKNRPKAVRIPMSRWYNENDREQLFKDKSYDVLRFDRDIAPYISLYWKPIVPFLRRLVMATWTDIACSSKATHQEYRVILEDALGALKQHREVPAKYACSTCLKRSRPYKKNDEKRWPYKYLRGAGPLRGRIPRPIGILALSKWQDSIGA